MAFNGLAGPSPVLPDWLNSSSRQGLAADQYRPAAGAANRDDVPFLSSLKTCRGVVARAPRQGSPDAGAGTTG